MSTANVISVGRRLLTYVSAVRGRFALSLILLLFATSMTAAKAWIIQPTVDAFLNGPTTAAQLWRLCAIVLAIFTAQALFNWCYLIVARMVSAGIAQALRADLFQHLLGHSLGYFTEQRSSDLMTRLINDISVFELSAVGALQGFIRNTATLMLLLGVMLIQDIRWGLVWFLVMIAAGFVLRSAGHRIVTSARAVQDSVSTVTHHLSEMTAGIGVILSFGAGPTWQARFAEATREHYALQVRFTRVRTSATALVEIITGVTLAGMLLWMGSAMLNGELTPGQLLSFLAVMFFMQVPAQRTAECVAALSRGFAAGGRAFELFDREPELHDPEVPRPLPIDGGSIEFRQVSFSYGGEPVLRDLSFHVHPRELVAIVGRSGAGKSTVARLIHRFYDPSEGQVLLDGIDVRDLRRDDLRKYVSYVAQDVFLFDDTIERNLKVGAPDATPEQIDEVVRLACLAGVIEELPDGLGTFVGERGVRLSGGQQQRIAIARAALTDARILVLDEATSALDVDLEQRILQNLVSASRSRTIVAITHRPTLAKVADRVLVMQNGRIVEEGTRDSLIAAGGEFNRLQPSAEEPLAR